MKRIKNVVTIICLIQLFSNLAAAYSESNLVLNPGFEIGTTIPLNWTFVSHNGNTPVWSDISHDGSKSIEIKIPGTSNIKSGYPVSDIIKALPSETYYAYVWGKTEGAGGLNTPAVRVVELDAEKNWIRQNNLPVFSRGTNDWELKELEFQTSSKTAYLYIYGNIWKGYGTFWMDEVELTLKNSSHPTPRPNPIDDPIVIPVLTPTPSPTPTPIFTPVPTLSPVPILTPEPISTPATTPTPALTPAPAGATIAYLGDARPSKFGTQGITELTNDLNQVIPQSPTGKVDAIFMIGDMDKITQTRQAYAASDVKNIPVFFVVGNHEVGTSGDVSAIRNMFSTSKIPLSSGPLGTDKTTYSLNVGGIHVINSNIYWDGNNNGKCDWSSPGTTDSSDDACFKYSSGSGGDGGYIPDALYNWIDSDLSKTSSWKIVIGHEPMYPKSRHVGDALDEDQANRDKLQDLFVSQKVAVYVAAHTHYAAVNNVGGVYHVDAGVSGQKTTDGEDPEASIFYTNTNAANDLVLTWKHENPTWSTPLTSTYTIKK